jgi:hypothetical protein
MAAREKFGNDAGLSIDNALDQGGQSFQRVPLLKRPATSQLWAWNMIILPH